MSENPLRTRAKDHLPTVLLTLLSIVQAFSLELMWAHVTTHDDLYRWSFITLLSWVQIFATFLGVLVIWLIYASLVMRFRWVPTTSRGSRLKPLTSSSMLRPSPWLRSNQAA